MLRFGIPFFLERDTSCTSRLHGSALGCFPKIGNVYFCAGLKKLGQSTTNHLWRTSEMKWETPSYNDLRFGFEVTMYIYNR